jgi:hypothetical protein
MYTQAQTVNRNYVSTKDKTLAFWFIIAVVLATIVGETFIDYYIENETRLASMNLLSVLWDRVVDIV